MAVNQRPFFPHLTHPPFLFPNRINRSRLPFALEHNVTEVTEVAVGQTAVSPLYRRLTDKNGFGKRPFLVQITQSLCHVNCIPQHCILAPLFATKVAHNQVAAVDADADGKRPFSPQHLLPVKPF